MHGENVVRILSLYKKFEIQNVVKFYVHINPVFSHNYMYVCIRV